MTKPEHVAGQPPTCGACDFRRSASRRKALGKPRAKRVSPRVNCRPAARTESGKALAGTYRCVPQERPCASERCCCLRRGPALAPLQAPGRSLVCSLTRRLCVCTGTVVRRAVCRRPVRHLDRLAEMRDRFLERRAAERLIARLAPPFDRGRSLSPAWVK